MHTRITHIACAATLLEQEDQNLFGSWLTQILGCATRSSLSTGLNVTFKGLSENVSYQGAPPEIITHINTDTHTSVMAVYAYY